MPREEDQHKGHRYLCSNPNCKKTFSRPKIIRYQVCPACQTIVNITESQTHGEIPISFLLRNPVKLDKQEMVEANKPKMLTLEVQPSSVEPSLEKFAPLEKKPEVSQESILPQHTQMPKLEKVEKPVVQETKTLEATTVSQSPSPSDCQYFFGYLGQRKKGEEIPNQCIECSKSLNCMLSSYYAKEESVEEIKKWYAPLLSR